MINPCLHLIIQYYNDSRPERAAEYDECLRRNLENPHIAKVHNLIESHTNVPASFRAHPKYVESVLPRWMTYRDALDYANRNLAGLTVCVANLDIFLDPSGSDWENVAGNIGTKVVLCLSRLEFNSDGSVFQDPGFKTSAFAESQDAWIFQAPFDPPDCDFEIGILGCDNAFAERIKRSGRIPMNAASRFKIFHYDRVRGKLLGNQQQVHGGEQHRPPNRHPERQGQLLLPDIDQLKSVDAVLNALNVSALDRYVIICEVLSRLVQLKNDG